MNERGLSESTQWAVVTPVALGLVLGLVQLGIWLHGRTVAAEAAGAAADRLAASGSRLGEAEQVARSVAERGGLGQVQLLVDSDGGLVRITVTARTEVFFDIGQSAVSGRAVVPAETVTRP